jgi:voltage-gated potassium channel
VVDPGRIQRLRAIPLFAGLPDGSLEHIAAAVTSTEAPAGQVLIEQGHPGSGLLILEEGTVVVERPGRASLEAGPGEFFGELALLTPEGVHTARVRARTPVRLLAISRAEFARLLDEEPRIAVAMLPTLARRMVQSLGLR